MRKRAIKRGTDAKPERISSRIISIRPDLRPSAREGLRCRVD